jgi:putative oxidoreductase
MAYGLLVLRVVVGLTMAGHGLQKLLGWFGGPRLKGTEGMFRKLGFPAARALAVLAALAETSGLLLGLGLVTPIAALAIAIVMLNAIGSVHWKNGFWAANGGYEFNLTLLAAVVAIAAIGPGRFSLDRLIGWEGAISGLWWGVGVLLAAALVSTATLSTRRIEEPRHREAPQSRDDARRAA